MSIISLSRTAIKNKIDTITAQLEEHEAKAKSLREELGHLLYLQSNLKTLTTGSQPNAKRARSRNESTKAILLNILKNEGKEMSWQEVLEKFREIRPDVKENTMRVNLSQLNTDERFPVVKVQDGNNFRYAYKD